MRRVKVGHAARWEYFRVIYGRYSKAEGKAKGGMLDEFCLTTGYHRKYAIRLLNGLPPGKREEARARGRKPQYSPGAVSLLGAVWEAAGYPWSVRLKAILPNWMPWIRQRYKPSAETERQLLRISARQIDRRLAGKKSPHQDAQGGRGAGIWTNQGTAGTAGLLDARPGKGRSGMADHLPHPQPAEVVPGSDCARKPPKEQRKPFKIRRMGLGAAELRLLCYGLYFIMQSMAVVLLRIQCRKQQLEFHSDRLLAREIHQHEIALISIHLRVQDRPSVSGGRQAGKNGFCRVGDSVDLSGGEAIGYYQNLNG